MVEVTHAEYDVPGRALRMTLHATNNGTEPVTIGEFTTAGIRFTNSAGAAKLDPNYPAELVAAAGLTMDKEAAILPGQTVDVNIESKDVLWEVQRLVDILHDPDQRFAGLLMSWTESGERLINPIWAPVLPVFTSGSLDSPVLAQTPICLHRKMARQIGVFIFSPSQSVCLASNRHIMALTYLYCRFATSSV